MTTSMIIKEEVLFQATPEQVWDLLINPALTKQYMFGCEVLSDWKVGSPVYWKGKTEDGTAINYVEGKVL
ncbi:MAG: SRPBCC domain-containing protein, partial [Saprospiraceae bacterium]